MHVRELRRSDCTAVAGLIQQLGYEISDQALAERVAGIRDTAGHNLFVAENGDEILGVMHVFERPSLEKGIEAVVQAMVVDAAHRGRGVGHVLMREAEAWAAARGLGVVSLHTRTDRDDAHAFYVRNGFEEVAAARLMRKVIAS